MSTREDLRQYLAFHGVVPLEENIDLMIQSGRPYVFADILIQLEKARYTAYTVKAVETLRGVVDQTQGEQEK